MARKIDHEERKNRIVSESLRLFGQLGYDAVNFGMIADACKISRTLLYAYFKDKRAIFNEAIDEVTDKVRARYEEASASLASADQKLHRVCFTVFELLFDNRNFVCVIADVLSGYRRKGGSVPVERVIAHTSGLLRILQRLIAEGVQRGEYRPDVNPARAANILYSQYEAAALRIAITGNAELAVCIDEMDAILHALRAR